MKRWWQDYFDIKYMPVFAKTFLRDARNTAVTTQVELNALQQMLPPPPAAILDAGCGLGRHSLGLAKLGYDVTGLDQSPSLIAEAQAQVQKQNLAVHFVVGEHRSQTWSNTFDAVINMFTAFGYEEDDADNLAILRAWYAALHPGGLLIMEMSHRDQVVANYRGNYWYELENGTEIRVQRHFDAIKGLNHIVDYWRTPEGTEGVRAHKVRLYSASELRYLLEQAGFMPLAWYGDFDLTPFTHKSSHLLVVAQKPGEVSMRLLATPPSMKTKPHGR